MNNLQKPLVGVGVMVIRKNQEKKEILLGKRKGSHCTGHYAFPGGHLEHGEDFISCALREVKEECGSGLVITNIEFQYISNFFLESKHYVHFGFIANWFKGNPQVMEPEKLEGSWEWHDLDRVYKDRHIEPLFPPAKMAISFYVNKDIGSQSFFPYFPSGATPTR